MLFGSAQVDDLTRRAFRRRVDDCRWQAAADVLDAGDKDLCVLTDSEADILDRLLWSRGLKLELKHSSDVEGPVSWRVRRAVLL